MGAGLVARSILGELEGLEAGPLLGCEMIVVRSSGGLGLAVVGTGLGTLVGLFLPTFACAVTTAW
jgi:hypothetical protein